MPVQRLQGQGSSENTKKCEWIGWKLDGSTDTWNYKWMLSSTNSIDQQEKNNNNKKISKSGLLCLTIKRIAWIFLTVAGEQHAQHSELCECWRLKTRLLVEDLAESNLRPWLWLRLRGRWNYNIHGNCLPKKSHHTVSDFTQHYAAHNKNRREPVTAKLLSVLQLYQHYTYLALYCIPVVCCEACRFYILEIYIIFYVGCISWRYTIKIWWYNALIL